MKDLRCTKCNKLLAKTKAKTVDVEIKCKCGHINNIIRDFTRSHSEKLQSTIIKK